MKRFYRIDLILWALPADLIEGLGLEGYVLPVEPETENTMGSMLSELFDWYNVDNREIVSCLVPGTTFPTEYIDGCPTRFINIIPPEMEKGEVCELLLIDVEQGDTLITLQIYVTWQAPGTHVGIAGQLRRLGKVLAAKYVNLL